MKRSLATIISSLSLCFLALSLLLSASTSTLAHAAMSTTVTALTNEPENYDGQEVQFVGEVIGDIFHAEDDMVWVTIIDHHSIESTGESVRATFDINASISVRITAEQASLITNLGRYGVHGTSLEITGIFNLACEDHQGQSDLHASAMKVVSPGGTEENPVNTGLLILGAVLIIVGVFFIILFHILRERQR